MNFEGLTVRIAYEEDIGSLHASELEFRIAVFLKELGYEYVHFEHDVTGDARDLTGCIPSRKAREGGQEPPERTSLGLTQEEIEKALAGPLMGSANVSQGSDPGGVD